jgi:hypothetical protein
LEDGMPVSILQNLKQYWLALSTNRGDNHKLTQDRLTFKTHCRRNWSFTVPHLETAPYPDHIRLRRRAITYVETIKESIIEIRNMHVAVSISIQTVVRRCESSVRSGFKQYS